MKHGMLVTPKGWHMSERQLLDSSNCNRMPRLFKWLHSNIAGIRSSLLGSDPKPISLKQLIIYWSSTQKFYALLLSQLCHTLPFGSFGWWNVTVPVLAAGRRLCAMAWRFSIELDSRWMAGDSEAGLKLDKRQIESKCHTSYSKLAEPCPKICRHNMAGCEYGNLARFPRRVEYYIE